MPRKKKRARGRRQAPGWAQLSALELDELERQALAAADRGETFSVVLGVDWSLPGLPTTADHS